MSIRDIIECANLIDTNLIVFALREKTCCSKYLHQTYFNKMLEKRPLSLSSFNVCAQSALDLMVVQSN
jgi:hypothetical protein